jgi:hypothetical protein
MTNTKTLNVTLLIQTENLSSFTETLRRLYSISCTVDNAA